MKSRVEQKARELLLSGERMSKYDLAERAHCHQRTAYRVLIQLMALDGFKIVAWGRMYFQPIPIFGVGSRNVPKPKPMTPAQRQRKRRKDVEVRWDEMMKKRSAALKARRFHNREKAR